MDAAVKEKWAAALRSGDYQQGTGLLRSADDKFCCLGVLCDVMDPEGWTFDTDPIGRIGHHGHKILPARQLLDTLGLNGGHCDKLAAMNDNDRSPFSVIADYIEANL